MQAPPAKTHDTQATASQHARTDARFGQRGLEQDPTILRFEGRIAISDDDPGNDPYNRTGKFRRLVR
jgi:hypothetical protein